MDSPAECLFLRGLWHRARRIPDCKTGIQNQTASANQGVVAHGASRDTPQETRLAESLLPLKLLKTDEMDRGTEALDDGTPLVSSSWNHQQFVQREADDRVADSLLRRVDPPEWTKNDDYGLAPPS